MFTVFAVCAAVGGTIMVCQVVLLLVGLGDSHAADHVGDFDTPDGGDFDAGDFDAGADDLATEHHSADDGGDHRLDTDWLFGVISVRTVVAAIAFFGLAGLAGVTSGWSPGWTLAVAIASGVAAMYIVHWVMQSLYRLRADGTVQIQGAVGQVGTVYLRIPGENSGTGKVTIRLQTRSMEFLARTAGEPLPTGARVLVTGVVGPDTLQVAPAAETADV